MQRKSEEILCSWRGVSHIMEAVAMLLVLRVESTTPEFIMEYGNINKTGASLEKSLAPGRWYLLVGTYDKNDGARLYVNGSQKAFMPGSQPIR